MERGVVKPVAPLIVWRRNGCRHRLLHVYLSPTGWRVVADGMREDSQAWLRRTPAWKRGSIDIARLRSVPTYEDTYPLELDRWPSWTHLEVGCDDGSGEAPFEWLIEDARKVRAVHGAVHREVPKDVLY